MPRFLFSSSKSAEFEQETALLIIRPSLCYYGVIVVKWITLEKLSCRILDSLKAPRTFFKNMIST